MLHFKKTSIAFSILLLMASISYAQPNAPINDVNQAYQIMMTQVVQQNHYMETNILPSANNLFCIPQGTDSIEVGLVVRSDHPDHFKYYFNKKDNRYIVSLDGHDTWVFPKNEFNSFVTTPTFTGAPNKWKRVCQRLGLDDIHERDTVVFVKAAVKDMFRPAYKTSVYSPVPQNPTVNIPVGYTHDHYVDHFLRNEHDHNTYPWTRRGYTYDWGNGNNNHIGMTEFVIKGTAKVRYLKCEKVTR